MGRDHTCHVRFRQRDPHAECEAPSNYGKVVKAPALPLGICVWYPPGKQQAVRNLRPPLPLRRKPAWRANCRPNTDIPSHYSQAHRHDWQTCAKLLNSGTFFFSFYNCPHSVHHQQGGAGNWTRKGHLVEELFAINTVNLRGITVGQDGVLTSEMLHKTRSQAILSEAAHYCVIGSARSLAVWCWMVSIERSKVRVEACIVQF